MAKLIEVEERDINYIFGKNKPYSLDVYQRDYRWADDKDYKVVTQLLLDIELRFEHNMKFNRRARSHELSAILSDVEENFKAYFLNTIMLNQQGSTIYIVDGQQRLTTLLLLLIKLYHLGYGKSGVLNVQKFIGEKIYEEDLASEKHFKISNPDRNKIIRKIFEQTSIDDTDITNITQQNLKDNYAIISGHMDSFFCEPDGAFKAELYNYYVYNLLQKVLIIEQTIKDKEDVAMIFETANDRGKELEPHEVLKGMLLGVLSNDVKEECNEIWNEGLRTFFAIDQNYKNVDDFFRTYFRAKYADTAYQYQQFANKYHRNLLTNERIVRDLDRAKPAQIEQFIKADFVYFYKTYLDVSKAATEDSNIYISSNHANEQGQQFLLILSAVKLHDPDKSAKISLVAKRLDQLFTISKLVGAGDNNDRNRLIYDISKAIRNKSLQEIDAAFENLLVGYFTEHGFPIAAFNDLFQYKYFEKARIDGRFSKYLLARIDRYLAEILAEHSPARQDSLFFITHSSSKPKTGYHIEHIFSNNEKIMDQFKDAEGNYDEKLFIDERNRLGAVLLLKGNENIRASNWVYKKKINSYKNSGFIWNRILTNGINQASLNSCEDDIKQHFRSYEPDTAGLLSREAIDQRQELLFKIITKIYAN